ncbi:MAG: NIPSNAP family protein [Limisphaerales bacterium]
MKRREFLKTSITASTLAGLSTAGLSAVGAEPTSSNREYYELRIYRLKSGAKCDLLEAYLEKAAIPAWNQMGVTPVGVFKEKEPKDAPALYVLIPYPSLDTMMKATARINSLSNLDSSAQEYLNAPKTNPGFDRIDSWLMLAFAGMPKLEQPDYSREKKDRMFEIRTYESYSEVKALKKVEMFNSGEIDTMREVGLGPIFYGQALVGASLPHLTYMLSAENEDAHKKHWAAFGKHPVWNKLKDDPQYADTVSNIRNHFLVPTSYSQV